MHGPPPLPPRQTRPTFQPHDYISVPESLGNTVAPGTLFLPGQWPTPELSTTPLGRYAVCTTQPYTSAAIQKALDALGPGSTLYLPQSSIWSISSPILLKDNQELATWGYPTDEKDMARLEAEKDCYPHIINARAKTGARLRNIVIDGGREKHGYEPKCGVMLQFGHRATDQVIDRCVVRHPRHWSCIQNFEGSQNVRITNNHIGPAGVGANKDQGKWADGISFAGANGLIAGNQILDATDGAIVVFGAPGSLITSNTIICRERLALGAINMVDWAPHDGNYTQTRVVHNTIITQGPAGYLKTGIGQGPSVWWSSNPSDTKSNRGAIVANNLIDSQDIGFGYGSIGYGFAVACDVNDWICVGNKSSDTVKYEGDISKSLPTPNVAPGPFVHEVNKAILKFATSAETSPAQEGKGVILQPEFSYGRGRIKFLIGIEPGASRVLSYQPGQFRLERGHIVSLKNARLSYDQDGKVRILDAKDTRVLWEGGPPNNINGKYLTFRDGGKLCILSGEKPAQMSFDFTPHVKELKERQDKDASVLVLSDSTPHLSITTLSSFLFLSSYIFPHNRAFHVNQIVARTYSLQNSQRTLLYTLSPYCQFVVLRSKSANSIVPSLPLTWPASEQEARWDWEIVWSTPNARTNDRRTDAVMYFQGDGNLVIRSQNSVPWASGSNNKTPPATYLRFGIGSTEEPWVEIIDSNGGRVWSR